MKTLFAITCLLLLSLTGCIGVSTEVPMPPALQTSAAAEPAAASPAAATPTAITPVRGGQEDLDASPSAPSVPSEAAAPTATRPSAQTPTDTPTAVPTSTPSPVSSPVVFGTNATAAPILRNTAGQAAAATTDASPRQGEGWALAIGLGSVVLAAILGGAAMVLWRRRRS